MSRDASPSSTLRATGGPQTEKAERAWPSTVEGNPLRLQQAQDLLRHTRDAIETPEFSSRVQSPDSNLILETATRDSRRPQVPPERRVVIEEDTTGRESADTYLDPPTTELDARFLRHQLQEMQSKVENLTERMSLQEKDLCAQITHLSATLHSKEREFAALLQKVDTVLRTFNAKQVKGLGSPGITKMETGERPAANIDKQSDLARTVSPKELALVPKDWKKTNRYHETTRSQLQAENRALSKKLQDAEKSRDAARAECDAYSERWAVMEEEAKDLFLQYTRSQSDLEACQQQNSHYQDRVFELTVASQQQKALSCFLEEQLAQSWFNRLETHANVQRERDQWALRAQEKQERIEKLEKQLRAGGVGQSCPKLDHGALRRPWSLSV